MSNFTRNIGNMEALQHQLKTDGFLEAIKSCFSYHPHFNTTMYHRHKKTGIISLSLPAIHIFFNFKF